MQTRPHLVTRPRSQFFTIRTSSSSKLAYKWVCLLNFVNESVYAPSTKHPQKNVTSERVRNSNLQRPMSLSQVIISIVHIVKPWRPSSSFLNCGSLFVRFLRNFHQYMVVILQEIRESPLLTMLRS